MCSFSLPVPHTTTNEQLPINTHSLTNSSIGQQSRLAQKESLLRVPPGKNEGMSWAGLLCGGPGVDSTSRLIRSIVRRKFLCTMLVPSQGLLAVFRGHLYSSSLISFFFHLQASHRGSSHSHALNLSYLPLLPPA